MKLACLFSGGKDSTYAIHLVKKQGHEVSCLLSVFPKSDESHLLHHPNLKWTKLQSESMKIPQLIIESSSDETSDELIGFHFQGVDWGLNDYFYDWLYLMGLNQNLQLAKEILNFNAFSDIEFNPKKSYNCQAYSAALYISASLRGIQLEDIQSPKNFKEAFPSDKLISFQQLDLF